MLSSTSGRARVHSSKRIQLDKNGMAMLLVLAGVANSDEESSKQDGAKEGAGGKGVGGLVVLEGAPAAQSSAYC